jgi:ADP-ribosyl-[dinitrogen reductase] hydrolase
MNQGDRYRGTLLGPDVGDALGTTLEFRRPGSFQPIDDMVGGGPFRLQPGQWTDDTSMALCLAESLVERIGFDPCDQMERYLRWWRVGYWSSTGTCFDIGNTTRAALRRFERSGEPYSGSADPGSAGNGLLVSALEGRSREELLSPRFTPVDALWNEAPLVPEIDEIAAGSFLGREPPEIVGSGYVVKALEAALWAFAKSESFEHGALLAVNLGDDADTIGAIYGQSAVPTAEWTVCLPSGSRDWR